MLYLSISSFDIANKNTRTLGAGDYPALKFFFIFKSAPYEKDNFFALFHDRSLYPGPDASRDLTAD